MEEQQLQETRQKRYRKKRLRKGRVFLFVLFIGLMALSFYIVDQYKKGKELAGGEIEKEIEFVADDVSGGVVNYLIVGVDSRGEEKSRSDTMMVLSWNKKEKTLKLISFMRDIYAEIPGYDQSWKLNTAYYLGGVQLLKDTLNHMFDLSIHHYVVMDFQSFESLIDILAPEGIEIEVEKDMSAFIGVSLTQGVQKLNGKELLGYARFRYDAEGDFGRVRRQQKVIDALKEELMKPSSVKNLPKFIGAAQGYVVTDLSASEELKTALSMISSSSEIEKLTIPVEGSYHFQDYPHAGSVIVIDLEENKQKLNDFLN